MTQTKRTKITSLVTQRAAIYTRISRSRDDKQLGVARQQKLCRELCEARGFEVVAVYTDDNKSATNDKVRPDYRAMLKALVAGEFDVLVALDQDRLLRKPGELEALFELCKTHSVAVLFQSGNGFNPVTDDGTFEMSIRALVDREEVAKIRKRIKRKQAEIAERGGYNGGPRAYGWAKDGIKPMKREQTIIKEIVGRVLANEPLRQICADLERRHIVGTHGKPFARNTLRRMLQSPRLYGVRTYNGTTVKAEWTGVIDKPTHRRLVALLQKRSRPQAPRVAPLSTLMHCGACGGSMHGARAQRKNAPSVRTYACSLCHKTILAEPTETVVIGEALLFMNEWRPTKAIFAVENEPTIDLDALDARLDEAERLFAEGLITAASLTSISKKVEAKRRDAQERIGDQALRGGFFSTGPNSYLMPIVLDGHAGDRLLEAWPTMSVREQTAALARVIETITIAPCALRGRRVFDESRISIVWASYQPTPVVLDPSNIVDPANRVPLKRAG